MNELKQATQKPLFKHIRFAGGVIRLACGTGNGPFWYFETKKNKIVVQVVSLHLVKCVDTRILELIVGPLSLSYGWEYVDKKELTNE